MRYDRGTPVDFGDGAKIDSKRKLHSGSFLQPHIGGLNKDAICAEVFCTAKFPCTSGYQDEYHGSGFVPAVETSLHKNLAYHCCFISGLLTASALCRKFCDVRITSSEEIEIMSSFRESFVRYKVRVRHVLNFIDLPITTLHDDPHLLHNLFT
jgi:hypothetical protein